MAWYDDRSTKTLNFVLVGGYSAGQELLQTSLSRHPLIVCHGPLLSGDNESRKSRHESYFGDSGHVPDWYRPDNLSAEQYFNNKIFDNALHGEQVIGVQLSYQDIVVYDLWDYLQSRCRDGDFCLLHVVRNPVACFIDHLNSTGQPGQLSCLDSTTLTSFVREHKAAEIKLNRVFDDKLVIPYHELLLDFQGSLRLVLQYLECPSNSACILRGAYNGGQPMQSYVSNWVQAWPQLPQDVLEVLTSSTLL
jgi:hypothetical protein